MQEVYSTDTAQPLSQTETSKVLRNTYMLLGLTLAFSALAAGVSMAMGIGHGAGLIMSLIAMALIWFVLPRTANSATGLLVVFALIAISVWRMVRQLSCKRLREPQSFLLDYPLTY
jgi:modulator of FtsH protease